MKKIKKIIISLVAVFLVALLCACSIRMDGKGLNSTETKETENQVSEELEKVLPTEVEESEEESTAGETEESTSDEDVSGEELNELENEPPVEETEEVTPESDYPGADVVELVNLRGDETTVYKLADGTYMDRIDRRFTYNGTDTWTDEEGVEWNEVVK